MKPWWFDHHKVFLWSLWNCWITQSDESTFVELSSLPCVVCIPRSLIEIFPVHDWGCYREWNLNGPHWKVEKFFWAGPLIYCCISGFDMWSSLCWQAMWNVQGKLSKFLQVKNYHKQISWNENKRPCNLNLIDEYSFFIYKQWSSTKQTLFCKWWYYKA